MQCMQQLQGQVHLILIALLRGKIQVTQYIQLAAVTHISVKFRL